VNPREMRAKADESKAKGVAIYERHKAEDAPEFSPEEVRDFDAFMKEAAEWLTKAEEAEAREQRINDLDARLKANGGDGVGRPGDDGASLLPHNDPKNTRTGRHGYSLLKALRQMDPMNKNIGLDGLELEVHQEMARGRSRAPRGLLIPWDLPIDTAQSAAFRARMGGVERRDLTTTGGAGSVFTEKATTMIEFLRNTMLTRRLGARVMAGMSGNFSIPKQTATGTAYWVTEGNAVTESSQTIGALDFSPSTVGAMSDYSRAFIDQTNVDAEQFIREDLALVLAIELDRVGFNGSGSGAEPEGIIPNSSVNVVAIGTDGGAMTWAKLVEMERVIEVANALADNLAVFTTPQGRGSFKTITRVASSTFGDFLWGDNGQINGYPAYSSNQMPSTLTKGSSGAVCSAAILGDWSQLIYALWSGIDVLVDPYTGGSAGNVRIITLQSADVQVRQPKAFSVCKDITTA
jgi:HK97 family phage major capsid protein